MCIKKTLPIRKRSFLLFELLLSLTLVTLCIVPLLKPHVMMARKGRVQLEKMSRARLEQQAYCAIKEKLFAHAYTWQQLKDGTSIEHLDELGATFYLERKDSHYTKKGMTLHVYLEFPEMEYAVVRTIYVERV